MDFEVQYSSKIEAYRREVRAWLDHRVPPDVRRFLGNILAYQEALEWAHQFQRELADQGWVAPSWPRGYGGGGLSPMHDIVVREELDARNVPALYETNRQVATAILAWGSEQQRERFLRCLIRAEVTAWRPLGYADAAVDPEVVSTQAVKDGDVYSISGEEVFFCDLDEPTHLWALAVTDPDAPARQRLSAFLIPADLSGITLNSQESMPRGRQQSVLLNGVEVPVEYRIGAEGDGWAMAQSCLDIDAEADRVLKEQQSLVAGLLQHCKESLSAGQSSSQQWQVRERVVEAYINTYVLRLIALRNRWMRSSSQEMTFHGPQYALLAKRMGPKLASTLEDVLGPLATLDDGEWAPAGGNTKPFRASNSSSIGLWTSIAVEEYLIRSCLGLQHMHKGQSGK